MIRSLRIVSERDGELARVLPFAATASRRDAQLRWARALVLVEQKLGKRSLTGAANRRPLTPGPAAPPSGPGAAA